MAITSTKVSQKWKTHQKRKANYMAALGGLIIVAALWACGQPWIATAYSGTPSCPVVAAPTQMQVRGLDGTEQPVNIPATCDNGWSLSEASQQQALLAQRASESSGMAVTASGPRFPLTSGVPTPVALIVVSGLVMALGTYLRLSVGPLIGVFLAVYAHNSLGSAYAFMTGSYRPEQLSVQLGWTVLSATITAAAITGAVSAWYVFATNLAARKLVAKETSKPAKSAWLAEITSVVMRGPSGANAASRSTDVAIHS